MAIKSRATLKQSFENGDVPTGSDYEDLIDSFLNLADTSAQTVDGPIHGAAVRYTTVCANSLFTDNLSSVSAISFNDVTANTIKVSGLTAEDIATSAISYKIPYGSVLKRSNNTVNANTSAFASISAHTASGRSTSHFTTSTSGRLHYNGPTADFLIHYTISASLDTVSSAENIQFAVSQKGTVVTATRTTFAAVSTRAESGAGSGIINLSSGEYVDLVVRIPSSSTNTLTLYAYTLIAHAISW